MAMFSAACVVAFVIAGAANGNPAGLDNCSQCKNMVESMNTMVSGEMRDRLLTTVCGALPGIRPDQCLILGHLSSAQLCQELGQCGSPIDIDSDFGTETDLSDALQRGLPCTLCENMMKIAHGFLLSRNNQRYMLHYLGSMCQLVPFFNRECVQIVSHYGPIMIHVLMHYFNPRICKVFHICTAGKIAVSGDDCKVCELGMGVLYDTLEDPNLETRIQQYTENLCTGVAGNDVACKSVTREATLYVLSVAEELRHSAFFQNACQRANICPADDNDDFTFE